MNIMLFGFKKCGKTYYGLKVADRLGMNFADSDLLVEKLYTKIQHESLPYRQIAQKHGFPYFRDLEKHVIPLLAEEKNCIISLGGGIVLDPENLERLQKVGIMIFLKTPKSVLEKRLLSHELPNFLDPKDPRASFEKFYEERLPIYEGIAAHVIDTENKTEEEVLEDLCCFIKLVKDQDLG
jgi:shikimate kinase